MNKSQFIKIQYPVRNENYSDPTKLVKVHTTIRTKSSLVGPGKN